MQSPHAGFTNCDPNTGGLERDSAGRAGSPNAQRSRAGHSALKATSDSMQQDAETVLRPQSLPEITKTQLENPLASEG